MLRQNKTGSRFWRRAAMRIAAFWLLSTLMCGAAYADSLCGEDEYIGIPSAAYSMERGDSGDEIIDYYDSRGRLAASVLGSYDYFIGYSILPKGGIITSYENDDRMVISTDDFRELLRYPAEGTACSAGDKYFFVYQEEELRFYDRNGQMLAAAPVSDAEPPETDRGWLYGDLYEADGYGFIHLGLYSGRHIYAIAKESGECITSEMPGFPEVFGSGIRASVGRYLAVSNDDEEGTFRIFTSDGEEVMAGVKLVFTDSFLSAEYVVLPQGEAWTVYDKDLQEKGRLDPAFLNSSGGVVTAGGEIVGMASPKLGGAVCTGSVSYLSKTVPCTQQEGGVLAATEEGTVFLPVPVGEELTAFSRDLMMTKRMEETIIYRREDGKEVFRTGGSVRIQDGSFLVDRDYEEDGKSRIYDENGMLLYESSYYINPCYERNYSIIRGPYRGIADRRGNWLIRELRYEE